MSTIVSVITSMSALWVFAAPIAGQALKKQIQEEVRPLSDAFIITLETNVRNLRNSIAAMEFKRDMCVSVDPCWTVRDAQDLATARNDLLAAESALAALKQK
jgi:hypothetical protein